MAADTLHCSTSIDRSSSGPAERKLLGSLAIHALDAVHDIDCALHAYRCVEELLMSVTREPAGSEVTNQQFHALISVLNDALAVRIGRAQRATHRVQKRVRRLA